MENQQVDWIKRFSSFAKQIHCPFPSKNQQKTIQFLHLKKTLNFYNLTRYKLKHI